MESYSLTVWVTPRASSSSIEGWQGEILRVRIKGVPQKGEVNQALLSFLAETLQIAPSRLQLISGHTFRMKRIAIEGLTLDEVKARL